MKNSVKNLVTKDRMQVLKNNPSYMYGMAVAEALGGDEKGWTSDDTPDDPSKIGTGAIKYDKGKPAVFQGVIQYFPRALWQIAEISTFGAEKYAWDGWSDVEGGFKRYKDAQFRHALKDAMGESKDSDSQLLHLAHEAWGALATLELYLRDREGKTTDDNAS